VGPRGRFYSELKTLLNENNKKQIARSSEKIQENSSRKKV
jgi:hypothetical protein